MYEVSEQVNIKKQTEITCIHFCFTLNLTELVPHEDYIDNALVTH